MSEVTEIEGSIIFINYRRTDAGWPADLLQSALGRSFGEALVFLDVRGIDAGDDFVAVLDSQLRRTSVLIVLIGNNWLHIHDRFGRRRLDQEHDWVRREIRVALQKPGCTVIPLLIDDANLPDEREALPDDISALLTRQRFSLRQAHSDDDIEALSRVIEKAGFRRLGSSQGPLRGQQFSDREVNSIVLRLQRLHVQQNSEFLGRSELFGELDLLFNRKTFRFEALRGCPEQRWADRLDSAYQTLRVVEGYLRNVRQVAEDEYPIYRDLVREVDLYCMQMGALLFDPAVDYNRIEEHIGKTTFKTQLPKGILFRTGIDKQPDIPDIINDQIERHRLRAVDLMDQLLNPKNAADPRSETPTTQSAPPQFTMIRLSPNQPSWDESRNGKEFHRKYELAADPVFEITVQNKSSDPIMVYRVGIRILQRKPGIGCIGGESQPVKVQSEFRVHCPQEWKRTEGVIDARSWSEFVAPIQMRKGDDPFLFTLMLENFCDIDNASSCEVRFYLVTDNGTAESRSIWLSQ
jgi:TIR domain